MASSFPAALDYLVTEIRELPEAAAPVVVEDGWPVARSDQMIVLGINPEEDDSESTASYGDLQGTEHESVEVPSIIAVRMGGTNAASSARARAFALYDAIRALVRSDRTLGGAVRPGFKARIVRYTVSQTADVRQAGEGRVCEIRWVLAWQHRG